MPQPEKANFIKCMGNGGPDETVYLRSLIGVFAASLQNQEKLQNISTIDNALMYKLTWDIVFSQNNVQSISLRCGWYCMQLKKWEKYDLQDNETVFDSYEAEPVRLQRTLFAIWVIYRGGKSVGYFQS